MNQAKKVVVILPTYNEVDNIGELIDALQAQFQTLTHNMHILVVDDGSPDRTADTVRMAQRAYDNLHLLEGVKAGLGNAYIRGMKYAMQTLEADVICEMDADFSHKVSDLPRLLAAIDQGADFAIGSRYVSGGSISANWGWLRKLNSRAGNIAARYIAGIGQVKDCTAGFRAIRSTILQRIDLQRLKVQGYAFQVVLLHAAITEGARVVEIPVDFVDRKLGESKLGLSDIVEFMLNVWWIRVQSARVLIKFVLVGLLGVFVNLLCFSWLLEQGLNKFFASPLAIEVSILSNFLLHNYWTFRRRITKDRTRIKGAKFHLVSFASLAVSFATFVGMSFLWPLLSPQISQLAGVVPAALMNYFLNAYWTFKQQGTPDDQPQSAKSATSLQ